MKPKKLTHMNYNATIDQPGVVLVEFFATWCIHCQHMAPIVEQVKELLAGKATVAQIDIDEYQQAANEANVTATPTFILFKNGKEVWRHAGEIEGEVLFNKVESEL